jgi:hypothetical protein
MENEPLIKMLKMIKDTADQYRESSNPQDWQEGLEAVSGFVLGAMVSLSGVKIHG